MESKIFSDPNFAHISEIEPTSKIGYRIQNFSDRGRSRAMSEMVNEFGQ